MSKVVRLHAWKSSSSLKPRNTKWLFHPWLPGGHLTIIAGRGGSGKGLLVVDLIARITTGREWPASKEKAPIGRCILVEAEDDFCETLMPRLIAAGANTDEVMILTPREFFRLPVGFIAENGVRLIALSPLVSCLEGIEDTNKELDVRARLEALMDSFKETGVAIIGLMHLNKKENLSTVERILGSGAFANFSRCVLFTVAEKNSNSKLLVHEKYNLSTKADDLKFTPRPTGDPRTQYVKIIWEATDENIDLDAALQRDQRKRQREHGDKGKPAVGTWLLAYLMEACKPIPRIACIASGVAAGYKKEAIDTAVSRSDLIKSVKIDGVTHWHT